MYGLIGFDYSLFGLSCYYEIICGINTWSHSFVIFILYRSLVLAVRIWVIL